MIIPVLKKDETWEKHLDKLLEEVVEVKDEIEYIDKDLFEKVGYKQIAAETLDVIQVCIGILDKIESNYKGTVDEAAHEHLKKLINRGWIIKKILEVRAA